MNKEFYAGQNFSLSLQATNNGISIIDLTSASITVIIKNNISAATITKRNITAGGSDSEITIVNSFLGTYQVFINKTESLTLSNGIYKVISTIVKSGNTYINEISILIKESDNDQISVFAIDKTYLLTYAQLTLLVGSDNLVPSAKYKILEFSEDDGLIITAKSANELETIAYLENDEVVYSYDFATNTITPLSEISETIKNKIIDFANNDITNQTPVTYAQLTALIAANDGAGTLKKGNKYLITDFQETWTGGSKAVEQIIVTASSPNTLERVAASITNPSDYIEYTVSNDLISGATKGVILTRKYYNNSIHVKNEINGLNYKNTFIGNFYDNQIIGNFHNNYLEIFTSNKVRTTNGFYGNAIGTWNDNTVDCYVVSNNVIGFFEGNKIFGIFMNNEFADENQQCTFNRTFSSNTASYMYACIFNGSAYGCTFGEGYKYNTFDCTLNMINFTSSEYADWQIHLQAEYECRIFRNSLEIICLQYINSDGQSVILTLDIEE